MSEIPLFPWWLQLFFAVAAVIGPWVGLVMGQMLTSRHQHRQWLRDNKKQEYREILNALSNAFLALVEIQSGIGFSGMVEGEQQRRAWNLSHESFRVLRSCLFVAAEVKEADMLVRWTNAVSELDHHRNLTTFTQVYANLNNEIVALGEKL